MVLLHGFIKKSQKTPSDEMALAQGRKNLWWQGVAQHDKSLFWQQF
ncbi:MAG: type II toxin-antitoxin system RelE/ParE family toxin [Caldilineaceae bacterium]